MRSSTRLICGILLAAWASLPQTAPSIQVVSPLGAQFSSLPDPNGAVETARRNLAPDPNNAALLLKLAQAQASVWQDREAVETLTRAIAIEPGNAALYTERGHRELPLREFTRARADLDRAAALNPKDVEAYYHLGLSHYFLGEFSLAADAFQHAVDLAPNLDSRINSTNWVYASLRRANRPGDAAKALARVTPDMKNTDPHTYFYLSLVRFFQGAMKESEVVPPQPPSGSDDTEAELRFDTVAYGVGNWHLYNGSPEKAAEYFQRIVRGRVWITWGFVGAEIELTRTKAGNPHPR